MLVSVSQSLPTLSFFYSFVCFILFFPPHLILYFCSSSTSDLFYPMTLIETYERNAFQANLSPCSLSISNADSNTMKNFSTYTPRFNIEPSLPSSMALWTLYLELKNSSRPKELYSPNLAF